MESGVLAGFPAVDQRVALTYGSYHDVDSSEMAFKIAGSLAWKKAARLAHPVLFEPVMAVEVVTPEEYLGDVIGDLSSRRGRVEGMESRGTSQVIRSQVPLAEMFGYATDLRSRTQGRADVLDAVQLLPGGPRVDWPGDRRPGDRGVGAASGQAPASPKETGRQGGDPSGCETRENRSNQQIGRAKGPAQDRRSCRHQWRSRSSSGTSHISMSGRWDTSTTARRR